MNNICKSTDFVPAVRGGGYFPETCGNGGTVEMEKTEVYTYCWLDSETLIFGTDSLKSMGLQ